MNHIRLPPNFYFWSKLLLSLPLLPASGHQHSMIRFRFCAFEILLVIKFSLSDLKVAFQFPKNKHPAINFEECIKFANNLGRWIFFHNTGSFYPEK